MATSSEAHRLIVLITQAQGSSAKIRGAVADSITDLAAVEGINNLLGQLDELLKELSKSIEQAL